MTTRDAIRVLAALVAVTLANVAGARPPIGPVAFDQRNPDRMSVTVEVGYDGAFIAERWTPVLLRLTSTEPIAGRIVAMYQQDGAQQAQIMTPFSTTPGRTVTVEMELCVPSVCESVEFELYEGQSFRPRTKITLSNAPDRGEHQLFVPHDESMATVLVIDHNEALGALGRNRRLSVPDADARFYQSYSTTSEVDADELREQRWEGVESVGRDPTALFTSWTAYDGLEAIVVSADAVERVDPRALRAIHEWVLRGGRLVIDASRPTPSWRRWLPPGESFDLVELSDPSEQAAGAELRQLVASVEPASNDDAPYEAIASSRRLVSLTDEGERQGWITRWRPDGSVAGALAEGPVGHGWVVVLGVAPDRVADRLWIDVTRATVRDALSTPLDPFLTMRQNRDFYYSGEPSGRDAAEQSAFSMSLDRLTTVPILSDTVFVMIVAFMVVLVVLIGPFDMLVLKKLRARHRSWATALVWVGLASVFGALAPFLLRTGDKNDVGRMIITDIAFDGSGAPSPYDGLTGVFSVENGRAELEGVTGGSWWRGVSSQSNEGSPRLLSARVPTLQIAESGVRANEPLPFGLGVWTYRTMYDAGVETLPVSANILRTGEEWTVTLRGLPEEMSVTTAALAVGSDLATLQLDRDDAGALVGRVGVGTSDEAAENNWRRSHSVRGTGYGRGGYYGMSFDLPGASRRTLAANARLASGRWAMILLDTTTPEPELTINVPARYTTTRVLRVLVPLEPTDSIEDIDASTLWPDRGLKGNTVPPAFRNEEQE